MGETKRDRVLLLVDDEENILSSLVRLFRTEKYTILRASSGRQGIEILKDQEVGVIISDQRMPEMTGVEFLSKVKLTHPDTIRIVLSGYTELKSITDAINEGAIYKFLTKPWNDDLLKKNVAEAFEGHEIKLENQRLNDELKAAYTSLEKINKELNENFEKKSEEAEINMHALGIAQEVLEHMPAGIIGIANDGVVAITNKLSEKWIASDSKTVIGSMAKQSLPIAIFDLYKSVTEGNYERCEAITLENSIRLEIRGSKLGKYSKSDGIVLVLTKIM